MKNFLVAFLTLLSLTAIGQGRQYVLDLNGGDYTLPTLVDTPIGYNSNPTQTYPLIMFLHGRGQSSGVAYNNAQYLAGAYLSDIYGSSSAGGPAYFIATGTWPDSFQNPITKAYQHFIVVSPQAQESNNSPTGAEIPYMIRALLSAGLRINLNQVYLTGLSGGGEALFDYITSDLGVFYDYFPCAAVVPMSMQINRPTDVEVDTTLAYNLYVWGFGSESDIYGIETHLFITGSYGGNNGPTPPALGAHGIFTAYSGGHCCWGQFYDPTYTQVINGYTVNIYQWCLEYSRAPSVGLPVTFEDFAATTDADGTTLTWTTAQEQNVDHFEVERSTDGVNFETVATVSDQATDGNSALPLYYSYTYNFN